MQGRLYKYIHTSLYKKKKIGRKALWYWGPRKRRGKWEVRFRTYVAPMYVRRMYMYVEYCLVQVEKKKEKKKKMKLIMDKVVRNSSLPHPNK